MKYTLESLYIHLNDLSPIPRGQWDTFADRAEPLIITKNSHYVKAGEYTDSIAICMKGLFRLYYLTQEGREYNKSFCKDGEFLASYSSLLQRIPSYFSIQALVDSNIIVLRYSDIESLYNQHSCWERLGRILVEQLYIKKENRERELLTLSADARYRKFLDQYGHLVMHIPQYHIASYLGITPVALSRIRKKLT